ncbi:MAG: TonB-dependent receptor, partial [Bacteroidaceae bacterium]|nr:TonB-dependent receptor [Bacteroidaceae bacterium]
MKKFLITLVLTAVTLSVWGQEAPAPKWLSKAQKSILSVITYDQNREKLNEGCGFVVSSDGAVISTYNTFKEAYSAVVVDASGNKYDVERILGADDVYGLVRFRISNKKTTPLTIASSTASNRGMDVLAIGYTKGKVNVVPKSSIEKKDMVSDNKYAYYTLATEFDGKQEGNGLFNTNGELVGIILSSVDKKSGAVDAAMGRDLSLGALLNRSQSMTYNKIYIKKGIPDSPSEALIYLSMKSRNTGNDEGFRLYPGADASFTLSPRLKLYASYNSSLRMPSFTELYYSVGGYKADKNLRAEKMQSLEAGFKYHAPGVRVVGCVYRLDGRDLIDWIRDLSVADAPWQSVNHARIKSLGGEITARLEPAVLLKRPGFPVRSLSASYAHITQDKKAEPGIQSYYALEYLRNKVVLQAD